MLLCITNMVIFFKMNMNNIKQQKIENYIIKIMMEDIDKTVDKIITEYNELSEKSKIELHETTAKCLQEIRNKNSK